MEFLKVKDHQIVNSSGQPVHLRGFNLGGWMNMEDFIDGFTGTEHYLRLTMRRILGAEKAQFFFDRLLDYFFTEEDAAFMQSLGANALRIPINYRHFERDEQPFEYLEEGFRRLDQAVEWCARHQIYVILDLHAVPGWQNPDWHSDNAHVHILLYSHKLFQDRFVALWEELARRYKDNPAIAGYDLMNEPCSRVEHERYDPSFYHWEALNAIYRRAAQAIRRVDPNHILFIEGDNFATQFDELDVTFDSNLAISTHNYTSPAVSPGVYPGEFHGRYWNRDILAAEFGMHSGTRKAYQHRLPILVGEFGVWYTGHEDEIVYRVAALDDQIGVFNSAGVHWTIWTYKDIGAMGAVNVAPQAEYLQVIAPILQAKRLLADWEGEAPSSTAAQNMKNLADSLDSALQELGLPFAIERRRFAQYSLFGYLAHFLQIPYAHLFKERSESEIDRLLQAFSLKNCIPNQPLIQVLEKNFRKE